MTYDRVKRIATGKVALTYIRGCIAEIQSDMTRCMDTGAEARAKQKLASLQRQERMKLAYIQSLERLESIRRLDEMQAKRGKP